MLRGKRASCSCPPDGWQLLECCVAGLLRFCSADGCKQASRRCRLSCGRSPAALVGKRWRLQTTSALADHATAYNPAFN